MTRLGLVLGSRMGCENLVVVALEIVAVGAMDEFVGVGAVIEVLGVGL